MKKVWWKMKNRKGFKIFFLVLIILFLLFLFPKVYKTEKKEDYNVILISIDTLRADHLGAYGYHRNTSPNIDRLAEKSYVFEEAVAQSTHTTPSHFSIFTSLYPFQHRSHAFSKDFTMLAEALHDNGYRTLSFNGGGNVRGDLGFREGFDDYHTVENRSTRFEEALSYINRSLENRSGEFFLFYHTYTVHDPYLAPTNYTRSLSGFNSSFHNESIMRWKEIYFNLSRKNLTEREKVSALYQRYRDYYFSKLEENPELVKHAVTEYDGSIRITDRFLGDLLHLLKQRGVYNETIIVFTSDHGEEFNEHGGWLHIDVHRETRRVPLIVKIPNREGGKIKETVETIDIVPTLANLLGIPEKDFEQDFEGISLLPLLEGGEIEKRFVLTQREGKIAFRNLSTQLEYYYNPAEGREGVYNISKDPMEKHLITQKLTVSQMRSQYLNVVGELADNRTEELEQRLENLGYIR